MIETSDSTIEIEDSKRDSNLSVYTQQSYVMIVLIGLIQGTLDICLLAYFYIYLYEHNQSPTQLSLLQAAACLPWVFKPILGMVNERVKLLGYNRKSYIFIISLVEFCMHMLICNYKFGRVGIVVCNLLQVGCVVFRNVIGGAVLFIQIVSSCP